MQTFRAARDLPNPLYFLGIDLSQNATGVTGGFLDALPYFILVGLVILTGFLQARQNRRNAPNMTNQMAMIRRPADRLRRVLAAVPGRPGPLLPGEQPLAARATGDDPAQDHQTGDGRQCGQVGGAIDVKSEAAPETRGPGGLRKLFQLPAATNGDATSGGAGNGTNGRIRQAGRDTRAKSSGPGGSAKGTPPSGTGKSGGSGGSAIVQRAVGSPE